MDSNSDLPALPQGQPRGRLELGEDDLHGTLAEALDAARAHVESPRAA
ncbi:MAG TPA: hypothetical protein VGX50_07200 [Longimicrobium sp.]|nr:hypothetical protein [Longimicrobium sp.]